MFTFIPAHDPAALGALGQAEVAMKGGWVMKEQLVLPLKAVAALFSLAGIQHMLTRGYSNRAKIKVCQTCGFETVHKHGSVFYRCERCS